MNGPSIRNTVLLVLMAFAVAGCKKTVDDATLTNNIKSALAADNVIAQQPVQVAVQSGVVTLTGNVSDETASSVAARDAAQVSGVKEVVNNISVAGMAVAPTITSPAAPTAPRAVSPQESRAIEQHQPLPPPTEGASEPPPPAFRDVTVPAGREITMRITQSLDSESTAPGTPFTGVTTRPLIVDGYVAVPAGASVSGTVIDAKDATHFKGSSLLELSLNSVRRSGERISLSTAPYVLQGKGRGTNTAEKVGGGAVVGAVLGGIFGGGRGAAIGAGAGAGGGAAIQGFSRGQQVHIASESVLRFQLTNSFTVRTSQQVDPNEGPDGERGLQQR